MEKKRYVKKDQPLSDLVGKIKLWPSRTGTLHGVHHIVYQNELMHITTHCGEEFVVNDSRHSRSSRWLRNRYAKTACPKCKVPEWKLEKYSNTIFR